MIFTMELDPAEERARARREAERTLSAETSRKRRSDSRSSRRRAAYKEITAERTGPVCEACGWDAREYGMDDETAERLLHAHHVIPVSCGGKDVRSNFAMLCPNCHALAHRHGKIVRLGPTVRGWKGPADKAALMSLLTNPATTPRKRAK